MDMTGLLWVPGVPDYLLFLDEYLPQPDRFAKRRGIGMVIATRYYKSLM